MALPLTFLFLNLGYDCGVFTCMFADFISKDCQLLFNQDHIGQCRQRIALSIMNNCAIDDSDSQAFFQDFSDTSEDDDTREEFGYSSHDQLRSVLERSAFALRVQQSKNGLVFRPECTSLCITKNDSADHPCSKKHTNVMHAPLDSAGQYVLFPAMSFH